MKCTPLLDQNTRKHSVIKTFLFKSIQRKRKLNGEDVSEYENNKRKFVSEAWSQYKQDQDTKSQKPEESVGGTSPDL